MNYFRNIVTNRKPSFYIKLAFFTTMIAFLPILFSRNQQSSALSTPVGTFTLSCNTDGSATANITSAVDSGGHVTGGLVYLNNSSTYFPYAQPANFGSFQTVGTAFTIPGSSLTSSTDVDLYIWDTVANTYDKITSAHINSFTACAPPQTITGVINSYDGSTTAGINGIVVNTCVGGVSATTLTIGGTPGSFSFTIPYNTAFCVQPTGYSTATYTSSAVKPVGGIGYPGSSGCNSGYYQNQIANPNSTGSANCNRKVSTGYNINLNKFANLTCLGFTTNLSANNATLYSPLNFSVNFSVSAYQINGASVSITSSDSSKVNPYNTNSPPSSPIGIGSYTGSSAPAYGAYLGYSGVFTLTFNVTGTNVNPFSTPCTYTFTVGSAPYFIVQGGDISSGSGGFGSSCNPSAAAGAGILAFNDGGTPTSSNHGSGTDLAVLAPSLIYGFSSSNAVSNSDYGKTYHDFNFR
jgi:hypothetical protein